MLKINPLNWGFLLTVGYSFCIIKNMKANIKSVNRRLSELGYNEILVKGKDYFYFAEGNAHAWKSTMVCVSSISHLSLESWIEEYIDLRGDSK